MTKFTLIFKAKFYCWNQSEEHKVMNLSLDVEADSLESVLKTYKKQIPSYLDNDDLRGELVKVIVHQPALVIWKAEGEEE